MAIVNSSRWPVTKPINMRTKAKLNQEITIEELLSKREENLRAFQKGLSMLDFLAPYHKHPTLTRELFIDKRQPLTASMFLQPPIMSKVVAKPDSTDVDRENALYWFMKYINELSNQG